MSTRQEYLDGLVSHEQYYEQFVDQGLLDFVARHFMVNAYAVDNIPLQRWDNLAFCVLTDKIRQQLKDCGDFPTLGGAVCILKQAARMIAKGRNELRRDTQTYVLFFSPERAGEAEQLYNLLQTKRAFDPMTPVDRWDDHLCEIASTRVADAYILVHNALRAGILVGYEVY